MRVLIILSILCAGCSNKNEQPKKEEPTVKVVPWKEVLKKQRIDDPTKQQLISKTEQWVGVKVCPGLKINAAIKEMGHKPEIEKVVVRGGPGEDRPEILTLYKYGHIIFIATDISHAPDEVDRILVHR